MTAIQKINSLLASANATTGQSDTTLTDAVRNLIDGYGSSAYAFILANYPSGATCTCSGASGSKDITSTQKLFYIPSANTYTVSISQTGQTTKTETVEITYEGQSEEVTLSFFSATLRVYSNLGSTVTASKDGLSVSGTVTYHGDLPSEYQEVEYIQGTGTQYINTGLGFAQGTIEVEVFGNSAGNIFRTVSYNTEYYGLSLSSSTNLSVGKGTNSELSVPISLRENALNKISANVTTSAIIVNVNDEQVYSGAGATIPSGTLASNIPLFAKFNNYQNRYEDFANGLKIHSFKRTVGDTEQIHLISCYRKADSVVGMYDIINDVFYTNSGTGTFLKGADVGVYADLEIQSAGTWSVTANDGTYTGTSSIVISAETAYSLDLRFKQNFQEVEYLQANGSQYIITNFYPKNTSKYEMLYADLGTASSGVSNIHRNTNKGFGFSTAAAGSNWYAHYGNQEHNLGILITKDKFYKLSIDRNLVYIDDVLLKTFTAQTFTSTAKIPIFCEWNNNYTAMGNGKIKYWKYWEDDVLLADLVPCYRKSDSVAGMYDVVNNVFYTNSGSGTFIVGGDVA